MAVTFGFYNSINKDRAYNANQFSQIFDGIIKDGVYQNCPDEGNFLATRAGNGMQVILGPGRAWFNGTWTLNDADIPVSISGSDYQVDRIDTLVLKVDKTDQVRANSIYIEEGDPSSNPQPKELVDTDAVFYHPLATIRVRAGTDTILSGDITIQVNRDERTPFVTGIIDHVTAAQMLSIWEAEWNEYKVQSREEFEQWIHDTEAEYDQELGLWENEQKQKFVTWQNIQKGIFEEWENAQKSEYAIWMNVTRQEFDEWFENIQYVLDGDVAGHLQDEIDELNDKYSDIFDYYNDLFSYNRTYETDQSGYINKMTSNNVAKKMKRVISFAEVSPTIETIGTEIFVYSDYNMEHLIKKYSKTTTIDHEHQTINDSVTNVQTYD